MTGNESGFPSAGWVVLPLAEYHRLTGRDGDEDQAPEVIPAESSGPPADPVAEPAAETAGKPVTGAAEALALVVELLSAKMFAMPAPGDDPEPLVRHLVTIAVAGLSLLPDRGEVVLRDLGQIAAQFRSAPPEG